jgi:small basic protein
LLGLFGRYVALLAKEVYVGKSLGVGLAVVLALASAVFATIAVTREE